MVRIIVPAGRIIDLDIIGSQTNVLMNKVPGFVYR